MGRVLNAVALNGPAAASCAIQVRKVPGKGRGVYAVRDFKKGEVIERAPIIEIPKRQVKGVLAHYVFDWNGSKDALALGVGSLFNHATYPNAQFSYDRARQLIIYKAVRSIKKGEEITIHYHSTPGDNGQLWFTPKE